MALQSRIAAANRWVHGKCFVNGELVSASLGGTPQKVVDPSNGELLGTVPTMSTAQIDEAIQHASDAQVKWAKTLASQRGKVIAKWASLMTEHTDSLAELITLESGKPLHEAKGEHLISTQFVEWYSGEAERINGDVLPPFRAGVRPVVRKKPVGVVGVITPWNMPSSMITRSCAAALAAGCSIVLKPSELTPMSGVALAQLAHEAGVPAGVINVVTGDAIPIGKALTDSFLVRKLCFTGSTRAGKILMKNCVDSVKKVSMELGGNAPFIVFEDADLDAAVAGFMVAKYRNAGQACICVNRIYCHAAVYDAFMAKLKAAMGKLVVGNGFRQGSTIGPVITRAAADRIRGLIDDAKKAGHTICQPAQVQLTKEEEAEGRFVLPTIITDAVHTTNAACSEIFGPLIPVIQFNSTEEVIAKANDTRAGLAAYYYTKDYVKQWSVAEELRFGMVGINEGQINNPVAPFGGVKESGIGRDGSKYGIESFLDICYHLHGGLGANL